MRGARGDTGIRLGSVTVRVPDPAGTAGFLERALHLVRTGEDGGIDLTVEGPYGGPVPARTLRLVRGTEVGVAELAFTLPPPAFPALLERAAAAGAPVEPGARGDVAVTDPHGLRLALCHRGEGLDRALDPSPLRPRRLGHVNLAVPDVARAAAFYTDVLGLRVSERVGDLLVFLRAGSDHHNLGLRGGAVGAGVHHVALEVQGWESYRVVCDHLASLGHGVEYGPGRHGPGHNLFVYLRDPSSGLRVELFADMAQVDEDHEPLTWRVEDRMRTVNTWGPAPPTSFLT